MMTWVIAATVSDVFGRKDHRPYCRYRFEHEINVRAAPEYIDYVSWLEAKVREETSP